MKLSDVTGDAAPSDASASPVKLSQVETAPPSSPPTTVGGLAGAVTRGLAPVAAGAGVGAALGAPFAGVGAVPGAIAGMGAEGLAELGGTAYNAVARHAGWPQAPTPQQAMDRFLDAIGVKRARSSVEQMAETAAGAAPFGATWADLGKAVAENSASAADKFIQSNYTRAIKPSVAGKGTASQLAAYNSSARSAIDSIVANKAALRFADEAGETAGELPKSIEQFADAIEQTKQTIFEKYDALARQAGQAGARVDLTPAVRELQKIAGDPVVKDLHPDLVAYTQSVAERLAARGAYSTVDAQRAVQNLNSSLKAFYKNPSYETASRASIDSMVANQLRGGLDKAIEAASAPGYQALKNEYGSLKAIEKDVVHRAVVEGRKNLGGGLIGNIGDIASADEVLRGVLTLNPAAILRGAGLKAFTAYVRHLRDPNRAVQRLFDTAQQHAKVADLPGARPPATPLALPPPTLQGPAQPWTRAGEGLMPPAPQQFTTMTPTSP